MQGLLSKPVHQFNMRFTLHQPISLAQSIIHTDHTQPGFQSDSKTAADVFTAD